MINKLNKNCCIDIHVPSYKPIEKHSHFCVTLNGLRYHNFDVTVISAQALLFDRCIIKNIKI